MKKHVLTVLLIAALILGMAPMSTLAAGQSFVINGKTVTPNSASGDTCSDYATNLLTYIYPGRPSTGQRFSSSYNLLRNKSATEREITAAHVKEFIQSVQPGAHIRVCAAADQSSNDADGSARGHSMVLAAKNDAAGSFTIFENIDQGNGYSPRAKEFTYADFAKFFHDKYCQYPPYYTNYQYFYYIFDYQSMCGDAGSSSSSGPSTLAFKSPNAPTALKQGSYFGLTGTVTSNYNITSVYGRIKNSSDVTVDSYHQKNINSKSFTIAYSGLDNNLEFNLLSPGAYYLTYEATDASGKTVSWKSNTFYIQGSTPTKTLTITFDPNGGTPKTTKTYTYENGEKVGVLPAVSRVGYTLSFWSTAGPNESFGLGVDSNTPVISLVPPSGGNAVTIYAHWKSNKYILNYNANGGSVSVSGKEIYYNSRYGGNKGDLPTPTRNGYTFDGWYTSASGGTRITNDTKVTTTGNQTLYAHWTQIPPKPNCDKGHTWGGWKTVKAATCTKEGSMERKCSVCGKTETQSSPALEHDYRVSQEADTYIRYTCFYCNDSYTEEKEASCDKGHTWGEWEEIEAATCLTNGKAKRVCSVCGKTEQLPILAYKHRWTDWSTVEQPSCELEGLQERVCEIPSCDAKETRILPALSHDYRVKQEANTSILYVCRNCGDSYVEEKEPEVVDNSGMINFTTKNRYSDGLFRDVKSGDWFSANVATAYSMGLMNGTGSGSFSPGNNMTLAEVITLAARIHSIYYTASDAFPSYDGGNWYDSYVNYARDKGIISENYNFTRPATREQVVHILARALPEQELESTAWQAVYADMGEITYMADVQLLSGAGVINGIQENGVIYFKPLSPITRAEVAAVIGRMVRPDTRVSAAAIAPSAGTSRAHPTGNGSFAVSTVNLNGERAPGNRTEETNLGDLVADAMVWQATKNTKLAVDKDHVVGIVIGGSIRASIPAGDITSQDIGWVLPFGNTVAVVYVTGETLLEALEASTYCTPEVVGSFPQVSGIHFTINTAVAYDAGANYSGSAYAKPNSIRRVTIHNVNGNPFDLAETYAIVTSDHVAKGGESYCAFQPEGRVFDTGVSQDEAVIAYITEQLGGVIGNEYAKPQGRITIK